MDKIAKIARLGTLVTEGVSKLGAPLDVIVLPKSFDVFDVEVFFTIKFGYKIPDIAWNVQENIKKMLDKEKLKVEHINVHVIGVDFEG